MLILLPIGIIIITIIIIITTTTTTDATLTLPPFLVHLLLMSMNFHPRNRIRAIRIPTTDIIAAPIVTSTLDLEAHLLPTLSILELWINTFISLDLLCFR
jgi:hypothetical protein